MYCPSCGNDIPVELKYCNRCGANLNLSVTQPPTLITGPVRLGLPSVIVGITIVAGLGIIFGGISNFVEHGLNPVALVWMMLFSVATLFGCTALLIRFLTKLLGMQRESVLPQSQPRPSFTDRQNVQQLPPRLEGVPSVTENTTRTFSPIYREPSDRGTR